MAVPTADVFNPEVHGRFRAERARPFHETLGVDSSPAMLVRAAAHARRGLSFTLGDLAEPPPGPFDVLFSNAALHRAHGRFVARYRERLLAALPGHRPFLFTFRRIPMWARLPPGPGVRGASGG